MSIPWHLIPALQPAPAEGVYFRRQSIDHYDKLPIGHQAMYGASWYDISTDKQVGSMCHCVVEMDTLRRFYLTEVWHSRVDIDSAIQALFQIQEGLHVVQLWQDKFPQKSITYGPKRWFIEPGQYDAGIGARINSKRVRINEKVENHRDHFRISAGALKQAMSIEEGARSLQADLVNRTLLLPRKAPWLGPLMAELLTWPASPSSSRVAALGLVCAARTLIHPAQSRPQPAKQVNTTWMAH